MNLCDYCKSKNTWDCEEMSCKSCSDFDLDFQSLPDEAKELATRVICGYLLLTEVE